MWITQDDVKLNRFYIDADAAYEKVLPEVLEALEAEAAKADPDDYVAPVKDQYTLEVAHNWIKLDAQMAVKMNFTLPDRNVMQEHIIRGGEGYKERWGWRAHPPGKHAELRERDENVYASTVAKEAKALYKKHRGYIPS